MPKFLLFGKTGWIGGLLGDILRHQGHEYAYAEARLEDRRSILDELLKVQPTHVLNASGVTGRPNIDWCETHKIETIRANVYGLLNLADVCHQHGVHLTNYGTGCIYTYDDTRREGEADFAEADTPNPPSSFYLKTKALVDLLLQNYDNVLNLRIRMPICEDFFCHRNLITKLLQYPKIVSVQNSFTVLPELLPLSIELALKKVTGPMNFTNPGTVSHNDIMALYKRYIDPTFTWANFSEEEQRQVLKCCRSNNTLNTDKLQSYFPSVLDIDKSLISYIFEPAVDLKNEIKQFIDGCKGL